MDTDCSVKFATEIHVYIFSLLLLSFTGQMECTAVPAQDSEFTAETNEVLILTHYLALKEAAMLKKGSKDK